jgi:predicted SAM-dependent methyltransferase
MGTRRKKVLLDLACGQSKRDGYTGVDYVEADGVDIVHDLNEFPWPWDDRSVDAIHTSHYVEHTPMYRPDGQDGLIAFVNECHRILKRGGVLEVYHPYSRNDRAFWDYFNREWREANRLDHYKITADFEVTLIEGVNVAGSILNRSDEAQAFARAHYFNVVEDLHVVLKARK